MKSNHAAYGQSVYKLMLAPALLCILVIGIVPIFGIVVVSLLDWNLASTTPPQFIGIDNFLKMMKDKSFISSLGIQAVLSLLILVVQLSLGLLAAISLNQLTGRFKWVRGLVMTPLIMPPVVVGLIWLTLFSPTISPINNLLESIGLTGPGWLSSPGMAICSIVIADTWANFPFVMIIVLAALQGIPKEIYEASSIDGANRWQAFIHITMPFLTQSLVLTGMLRLIESLKSFPLILILTGGGPGNATEVTNFYAYTQAFQYSAIGYASALAFVVLFLTVVISIGVTYLNGNKGRA